MIILTIQIIYLNLGDSVKVQKNKFYLSNNIKLSIQLGLNGIYIPSFNKKINYIGTYSKL